MTEVYLAEDLMNLEARLQRLEERTLGQESWEIYALFDFIDTKLKQ